MDKSGDLSNKRELRTVKTRLHSHEQEKVMTLDWPTVSVPPHPNNTGCLLA